jgi:tRNA A-37 threonylcarbamoyl transferase component Bud32
MQCIVKERFKKKYRVAELDEKLTRQRILQVRH